jgi:shikimate kinase/3-dehydroquinate synthase
MTSFPADRNIVITGFMGTGKSTVGRLLAERLGRPYWDMDEQIEAAAGKSIARIFAEDGEAAFRVAEAKLCRQFADQRGIVVSTGGGALVSPINRHVLAETGVLICLTATVEEIARRVEHATDRPLLPGDHNERRKRIRDLLHERRHAYAAIAHQIDTTGIEPAEIVNRLLETLEAETEAPGMTRIPVTEPGGTYDICIGTGILSRAGTLMRNRGLRPGPVAVVTNAAICAALAQPLLESLAAEGYEPTVCEVPEGEQYKTLDTIRTLYDRFLDAKLDRRSAAIALGGGVIGDMTGFAAATYLRGMPFVQIPTSLLAMVDASVGGKTGVDMPQGKNLVGAFKHPHLVIIDPNTLETLPAAEFRSGLAEVIKHGIIGAPDLFEQLEEYGPTSMTQLVADAVRVKVRIVEEDPFEQGKRMLLNLGHTFGHAVEHASRYAIRHGEAVAIGLAAAAHLAHAMGRCSAELAARIENVVDRLDLPVRAPGLDVDEIMSIMGHDKKRAGKTLRFVLPQALGDVVIVDSPGEKLVREAVEYIVDNTTK